MSDTSTWIALGSLVATLITVGGGIAALLYERKRDQNKPALDASNTDVAKTTVQAMVDASNAYRDARLWQLESYLNLDAGWHFNMMTQFRMLTALLRSLLEQLRAAGVELPDIEIPDEPPAPPAIPEPPRRG